MADHSPLDPATTGRDGSSTTTTATASIPAKQTRQDAEFDPSVPGAGAQRVVAITQLYFRLTNSSPLTITVADALCLTFGAAGASMEELSSYLGLSGPAIRAGIEGIPGDMRCTTADLEDDDPSTAGPSRDGYESPEHEDDNWDDDVVDGDTGGGGRSIRVRELRHYLNYKRILPAAYAHLSHILLALCVSPLPESAYTEGVRQAQMRAVLRSGGHSIHKETQGDRAVCGGLDAEVSTASSISPTLRRREALEGIYCCGCQFYFALQDFAGSVARCPTCRQDVLRTQLTAIKALLDSQYTDGGRSLVTVPGSSNASCGGRVGRTSSPTAVSPTINTAATGAGAPGSRHLEPWLNCALARDPFLVQQALAFLFLYSTPFAALSDARCIVDSEAILTEPEYDRRLRGGATLADEFRALHRNPNRVRVRLVSQKSLDAAMRESNARKIAKRSRLPPWLSHATTLASLASGGHCEQTSNTSRQAITTGEDAMDGEGVGVGAPHVGKHPRLEAAAAAPNGQPKNPTVALRSHAAFIACEFFDGDFEPVLLPRNRH